MLDSRPLAPCLDEPGCSKGSGTFRPSVQSDRRRTRFTKGRKRTPMAQALRQSKHTAAPELRERLRSSNMAKLVRFVLLESEPGRLVLEMRVERRHKQVHGVVHGGVLAALADTAGWGAAPHSPRPGGRASRGGVGRR